AASASQPTRPPPPGEQPIGIYWPTPGLEWFVSSWTILPPRPACGSPGVVPANSSDSETQVACGLRGESESYSFKPTKEDQGTNGRDDARHADPDDRAWGLRSPHHHRDAPADPAARQADRPHAVRGAGAAGHAAARLQRPERRAEAEVRGGERARSLLRHPGTRPIPLQRVPAAGRGRRRYSRDSRQDPRVR